MSRLDPMHPIPSVAHSQAEVVLCALTGSGESARQEGYFR